MNKTETQQVLDWYQMFTVWNVKFCPVIAIPSNYMSLPWGRTCTYSESDICLFTFFFFHNDENKNDQLRYNHQFGQTDIIMLHSLTFPLSQFQTKKKKKKWHGLNFLSIKKKRNREKYLYQIYSGSEDKIHSFMPLGSFLFSLDLFFLLVADLDQFIGQFGPWLIRTRFLGRFGPDFVVIIYQCKMLKSILNSYFLQPLLCNIIIISIFIKMLVFN